MKVRVTSAFLANQDTLVAYFSRLLPDSVAVARLALNQLAQVRILLGQLESEDAIFSIFDFIEQII